MLIFWDKSEVLLSVPKTGTQARESSFGNVADICLRHPQNLKHASALDFRRRVRPFIDPNKSKKFKLNAVMREPIDWLGSWFRYRSRPVLDGHQNSTANISFDDFIDAYTSDAPPPFARVGNQSDFVLNGQGKIIVPQIFAYKDTMRLDRYLASRLSVDIVPGRVNVSPKAELTLSSAQEVKLRDSQALEFELYSQIAQGAFLPKGA